MLPLRASVGSTASAGVGEPPPAARALAVTTSQDRRERTRLRQGHNRPEGQRGPMGGVAIRDPADRVAEDPGLTHHNSETGSYRKFHILSKPRLLPFSFATFR